MLWMTSDVLRAGGPAPRGPPLLTCSVLGGGPGVFEEEHAGVVVKLHALVEFST